MASWYGEPYHGRRAANGEIYDMNKMTAAHRTLPFDTLVDVLNLDNQQAVQVRITDRGPFVDGRIIDLSRAAAQQISMLGPGTAKVRLKVVGTQSRAEMPSSAPPAPVTPTPQTAPQMAPPPTAVPATPPDPPQGPAPAPPAIAPPQDCPPPALTQAPAAKPAATRSGAGYAVQIGAYTDAKAAGQLQQRMASRYGNAYIENVRSDKGMLYRVRVGPRPTMAEAAQLAASLERENFQSLVVRVDSRAGDF